VHAFKAKWPAFGLGILCFVQTANAGLLRWDSAPATTGIQDGAGNWSNLGTLTNWWNGTQNVAWSPGATAVIGSNLTSSATITLNNAILAGGLIFSNNYAVTAVGQTVPGYTIAGSAPVTNLMLSGGPATIIMADNIYNPNSYVGVSGQAAVIASLVATGGLSVISTAAGWQSQISFDNASNLINGTLEIGTPGTADYNGPTALQVQFNSSGLNAGAIYGCTNLIIHTNSGVLLRGTAGSYTLNWPKNFIISGDGIPSSFFCFGAINFSGPSGSVFPANIQLAGDSTVILTWGNNNAVVTNTGSITGTGRLRLNQSANRPTTGSMVVLAGTSTYIGNTIIDGGLLVQAASGANNRLPVGTSLQLGDSGLYYAANGTGTLQSSYNGYGALVLGDAGGPGAQMLAGLTSDTTTFGLQSYVTGGNASSMSVVTVNNSGENVYLGTLGGSAWPANNLALIKGSAGTLYLDGTNLCAGGYTINSGTLVFGNGASDYPLTGPITNNAAITFNVAGSRTYSGVLSGNGTFNLNGPGVFTFAGTNVGTGAFNVQAGALAVNTTVKMTGVPITLSPGTTLQENRLAANDQSSVAIAALTTSNATINFNLAGSSISNVILLSVQGALTNYGNTTINLINSSPLSAGRYPLIAYGSYQSNVCNSFAANLAGSGATASIQNNPGNHSLDIVISTASPPVTAMVQAGKTLNLSWPSAYVGWQLQCQTNPLDVGLSTNWISLYGTEASNFCALAVDPGKPAEFFRLVYPPAAAPPIFSNSAFAFYSDRMVSTDVYAGTYRSTDGVTITEDGNPSYLWNNAQAGKLYLQTPYPILSAIFALAVADLFNVRAPAGTASAMLGGYSPGSIYYVPYFYMTHGSDVREYTRDYSQETQWGDIAILDPVTTRGTLIRRCDITNNVIREDAVVTSDSIHFISAAWEYFKITGDTNLLTTCWSCMTNTMYAKQAACLDPGDGLWFGGPWSDNVSGYVTAGDFNNRLTQLKSLYCNLLMVMAWRDLGLIAGTLGFTNQAALCSQASTAGKAAVNLELYRPEFGTYCYYENVSSNTIYNYREDISAGLLYLSGVASNQACMTYHSNFVATPYGYRNVDPILPSGQTSYHGGNVWEDEEGFHGWAMSLLGQPDELEPFIFWHARSGLPLKEWQEGTMNPSTGQFQTNYTMVSWGAMGYTSYWTRGVFGIIYNPDGIQFQPCVPGAFGNDFYAVLNNFTYRNSDLRIVLTGCGTVVQSILVDGAAMNSVPANLASSHLVQIIMANAGSPIIPPSPE
jgi:autotransporter-associated beta strand protein